MAEHKIKIELYRNKSIDELTKILSDPDAKPDTGSASASVAAIAAAFLCRSAAMAARVPADRTEEEKERLDWLVRNTEILRSYMVNLVDEDVRCRGPLRRALTEGDEQKIEAARQTAVNICSEIIHMAGTGLELAEELAGLADAEIRPYLKESAELYLTAAKTCIPFILHMADFSSDDTYRYVLRRENELNLAQLQERYDSVTAAVSKE